MNPEISIVIPAYNASKYLKESVASIQSQTFKSWEVIIVNDGSTDNTFELAKSFLVNERIKLINQENKGVSAARNAGIKAANGKYIAFLDADDFYLENNLQLKYDAFCADESIDFVYSDILKCDNNLNELYVEKGVEAATLFEEVLLWEKETIPGFSSNIVIKAEQMKGRILFDENLSNCADRFMKILLGKYLKGFYIPKPLVKYRDVPGSMSKKVSLLDHDENYIIRQIKNQQIIPPGKFRRKVMANIYVTLSGSWYTNANKPIKAVKYGIKATFLYPSFLPKIIRKLFS